MDTIWIPSAHCFLADLSTLLNSSGAPSIKIFGLSPHPKIWKNMVPSAAKVYAISFLPMPTWSGTNLRRIYFSCPVLWDCGLIPRRPFMRMVRFNGTLVVSNLFLGSSYFLLRLYWTFIAILVIVVPQKDLILDQNTPAFLLGALKLFVWDTIAYYLIQSEFIIPLVSGTGFRSKILKGAVFFKNSITK